MKQVRCPECGHIQYKRKIEIFKLQDDLDVNYQKNEFLEYVHCEQCGTKFLEEENEK